MLVLGPIAFASPWVLLALPVLPAVWWLLRVTPPAPRRVRFPAVRLLRDLVAREETPAHTPLWLLLLRLLALGLVIAGFSGPVWHPTAMVSGRGPVVLVVDDGWAAARNWPLRLRRMTDLIAQLERQGREVVILTTAPSPTGGGVLGGGPVRAVDARRLIQGLEPRPWPVDRAAAAAALRALRFSGPVHAVWLCDGVDDAGVRPLLEGLQRLGGGVEVAIETPMALPDLVLPPMIKGEALVARLVRAVPESARAVDVRLSAGDGRLLAVERATFAAGAAVTEARFALPLELRNQAVRLSLEGQATVGATVLLDDRWRRRPVGLVVNPRADGAQPLLDDLYYLERALAPFSELRRGDLAELIGGREGGRDLAVVILADAVVTGTGAEAGDELKMLETWVGRGGLLVRFAGPRLAHAPDALLPVRLRRGDRVLGGALSWDRPAHLAPFDAGSPFAGLTVAPDVTIERQVLAEPTLDTAEHTWVRLADGTPLVTAIRRGQGMIVLVHTTANPEWSNLAMSGLFVDMLRRLVALSGGVVGEGHGEALAPLKLLDSLGRLGEPSAAALAIPERGFDEVAVGPQHPPGFYGTDDHRRALNLTLRVTSIAPLRALPAAVQRTGYVGSGETDLKPALVAAAVAVLLLDMLIGLWLRGLLAAPRRLGLVLALALALAGGSSSAIAAGNPAVSEAAERASAQTWLAYVVTGDGGVDPVTRSGLEGLARVLNRRTAVDVGGVAAVDLETDDLSFFPLLYWVITEVQPPLSLSARQRVNAYLGHGGTILFDTRDPTPVDAGAGRGGFQALRGLTDGLDIPPLVPVPPDHVLTRAFYLLQEFPGRLGGGALWVEAREERRLDGVSSVMLGGNDWAGAWAVDAEGRPLSGMAAGGDRQRELALRFGVNAVMYALTGNYKADQVHVPAILQRIGR